MADDDVQLTDLEVIQRYSLAVRGASASRADLVAALQADLDWLQGGRRRTAAKAESTPVAKTPPAQAAPAKAAPVAPAKAAPAKTAPARAEKTAPAKAAPEKAVSAGKAARTPAKKAGSTKRPAKG